MAFACDRNEPVIKKPDNLLNEDTYVDLLFEMQMLKVLQYYFPPQDTVDSLKKSIFEKYDIEEERFLDAHSYYQSRLDDQLKRVDKVINRLQDEIEYFNEIDSLRKSEPSN